MQKSKRRASAAVDRAASCWTTLAGPDAVHTMRVARSFWTGKEEGFARGEKENPSTTDDSPSSDLMSP
jgi:hypothetical protein